jgi:4-alpha-glucanotransferase
MQQRVRLIAAPRRCPGIDEACAQACIWGVTGALYGLHGSTPFGPGTYRDLGVAAEACAAAGADFFGINPVHAIGWTSPQIISPYSPTHRGFLNTVHLAVDLASAAQAGGESRMIDYSRHAAHHRPALEARYREFVTAAADDELAAFRAFCLECGDTLSRFTLYESLAEVHGADWRRWPASAASTGATALSEPPVAESRQHFHAWQQWLADEQLRAAQERAVGAGMALGLYLDLAVGPRRNGAEAWCGQDTIAAGVSIGAPPDHLTPAGQNWNLAAFAPARLAAADYAPFRSILRQSMRHCGMLRIDHVLGLNRMFWVPDDGAPGGYIKQPFDALRAIVRIEAERNKTVVVGEDLGLVPDGFRDVMNNSNIYSYSVLQYEKDETGRIRSPSGLRPKSLVCFGTHDTPTLAGYMQGRDIDWWEKLGWIDKQCAEDARLTRVEEVQQLRRIGGCIGSRSDDSFSALRHGVYNALAGAASAMVAVSLDDVFGEVEAQNLPGTITRHPNWQRRYKLPVQAFPDDSGLSEVAEVMAANRRGR